MPAAVSSSWWDTEELNHCVFGHKSMACSLEMDLRDEMITLFQLLFCSPRGLIPPGEYQRRSVMPACCCCLAQIVYFKNLKFVLTPWMSRLHIFCLFYLRLLLMFKTSQMFKTLNIFFLIYRILDAVPVSDFLPGSIYYVQLVMAAVCSIKRDILRFALWCIWWDHEHGLERLQSVWYPHSDVDVPRGNRVRCCSKLFHWGGTYTRTLKHEI